MKASASAAPKFALCASVVNGTASMYAPPAVINSATGTMIQGGALKKPSPTGTTPVAQSRRMKPPSVIASPYSAVAGERSSTPSC